MNASILLARAYVANGEKDKARELFQKAVEVMRLLYGDDSGKVASVKREMNLLK